MSNNNSREILMPQLLLALGDALRQSFVEMSPRVKLLITADPISLGEDDAIPLALFANELITNAYKYAFPEECSGNILVKLKRAGIDTVVLEIIDTGIGIRTQRHIDVF